jgi:hypothetical protein
MPKPAPHKNWKPKLANSQIETITYQVQSCQNKHQTNEESFSVLRFQNAFFLDIAFSDYPRNLVLLSSCHSKKTVNIKILFFKT